MNNKRSQGTAIYCKSLKQIDLNDVVTFVDRPSNGPLGGGTKQTLRPICNDADLRIAIQQIAYRLFHPGRNSRGSSRIRSKVLDLVIIYKVVKQFHKNQPSLTPNELGYITGPGMFLYIIFVYYFRLLTYILI